MPSQPDPNSPFLDTRLEAALGVRGPGTPSSAGKPGPQSADVSFPAPPSVNTAPPGRPTATQPPAPGFGPGQATPTRPATGPGQMAPAANPSRQPGGAVPSAPAAQPAAAPANAPLGTVGPSGDVTLTPDGAQRYREAVTQVRERLGPMPRVMRHPSLPEMPVELGRWNYNPFTASWAK